MDTIINFNDEKATPVKNVVHGFWSSPVKVEHYCRELARYFDGECLSAWKAALSKVILSTPGQKIVDMGTGPGIFSILFALMGHASVGLDFSETMLAKATDVAGKMGVFCEFIQGDAEKPEFESASVDVITTRALLWTLPRPGFALREWNRILKPGGRVIVIGSLKQPQDSVYYVKKIFKWGRKVFNVGTYRKLCQLKNNTYRSTVNKCPLKKHSPELISAMLEASGFVNINYYHVPDVYSA
jgi:ubiquinone/menaquinone biosynthesis C-methylase UbiE